jgi:hypothetical protein
MKKLTFFLILIHLCIVTLSQDSYVCNMIKSTLEFMKIDVQDVKIADGRAKGGVRMLIVTFKVNSNHDQHAAELTNVLECGLVANNRLSGNIDEISTVASDRFGNALAIVNTKVSSTQLFMKSKDAERYIKSWNVMRIDNSYLSSILSLSKQN